MSPGSALPHGICKMNSFKSLLWTPRELLWFSFFPTGWNLTCESVWSQVSLKTCKEPEDPQTWPSLPALESVSATYRNVNVLIKAKCLRKRESVFNEYDKRKERCLSKECRQRNMSENKEIIEKHVCVSFILYLASSHLTRPYGYINYRSKVWYKDFLNVLERGQICSPRLRLFIYLKTVIFWILLQFEITVL